jgi:hypothetical protein
VVDEEEKIDTRENKKRNRAKKKKKKKESEIPTRVTRPSTCYFFVTERGKRERRGRKRGRR